MASDDQKRRILEAKRKAFEVKLRNYYGDRTNLVSSDQVVVKNGPLAFKSAAILRFGNKETGDLKRTELRLQTWAARPDGPGFDFDAKAHSWACVDDEIGALQALLNGAFSESGRYRLQTDDLATDTPGRTEGAERNRDLVRRLIKALSSEPALAGALAEMDDASVLATIIQSTHQKAALDRVREIVEDPNSIEPTIQKALQSEYWMFGGRYVGVHARRNLTVLDQIDIPLLRGDGALHIVELKQANVTRLVVGHRNHYIVGDEVHRAVAQTMNYLLALDEHRAQISTDLGVDCRRASATVGDWSSEIRHGRDLRSGNYRDVPSLQLPPLAH